MNGGKIEVAVMGELLIGWPREGPECDALVGLNIFNEVLWQNREHMEHWVSVNERLSIGGAKRTEVV